MHRYIGNKTKIVDEIINSTNELISKESTVVDLMCGTASVSKAFKQEGYNVIAADLMTHASFHAIVELMIDEVPSFDGVMSCLEIDTYEPSNQELRYIQVIEYLNQLEPHKGYFYKEFSPEGNPKNHPNPRKYFSSKNAQKIDAIIKKLNYWRDSKKISENENALLRHDLILSVNPIANISGTYGHFHAKPVKRSLDLLVLKGHFKNDLFTHLDNTGKHKVYRGYAEDISKEISADLCYIDPPYMKRQYAANYHILETISRGDEPEAIGASGLRPWRDQYSDFCSKVKVRDSFRSIFKNMDCNVFLISYSEDGLLSLNELEELLEEFGEVDVKIFSHKRFRSNKSKLDNNLSEYLFTVKTYE